MDHQHNHNHDHQQRKEKVLKSSGFQEFQNFPEINVKLTFLEAFQYWHDF